MDKCMRINEPLEDASLFLVKDPYGRIHTNFTNISRHIRENFIYLDGENLTEVDIISSQPAILYSIIKGYLSSVSDEARKKYINDTYVSPMERTTNMDGGVFQPRMSKLGFDDYVDMLENTIEELKKYERVLRSGVYEYFQDKWQEFFERDVSRKKLKKLWLTHIFGLSSAIYNREIEYIWNKCFPLMNKIIKIFKESNYKLLAHELQKKESDIMFNQLCPRIDQLGINYFTVHDCVAVKKTDAEKVRKEFIEVLDKNNILTGVS
jgi:hypothetical protein